MHRLRNLVPRVLIGLLACAALSPAAALGADRILWNEQFPEGILSANLDGTGASNLSIAGAHSDGPFGLAIDSLTGRAYWPNADGSDTISFANLDGSGGGDLNTTGAAVDRPMGVAIDPEARRIYWGNTGAVPGISFAKLDGSGGGDLDVGGAPIGFPFAVAIDPAAGRIYWGDGIADAISFAALDGTGASGTLDTDGVIDGPRGLAIDAAAGRIYWINAGADSSIWSAKLDGTDDARLASAGARVAGPQGLAIDPAAGRIYWGENGGVNVAFARLDGSGGGDLITGKGGSSAYPALLLTPRSLTPPSITGGSDTDPLLTCTDGTWAPDLPGSFLYQAPQGVSLQWSRDGVDIAGATEITLPPDTTGGTYRCRVTAENAAGGASQTSAPHVVPSPAPPVGPGPGSPPVAPGPLAAFDPDARVTISLVANRIPARGPVVVRIVNANPFAVGVALSGQTTKPIAKGRRVKIASQTVTLAANAQQTLTLKLSKPLRRLLTRKRRLSLALKAVLTDPAGTTRTIERTIAPKLLVKKR